MSFLPKDYEAPVSSGGYMKFTEGDNQFRVLSPAIVGWEYWTSESKPVRSRIQFTETPDIKMQDGRPTKVKHFWAFVVYNYVTKNVEILQITQATIQAGIMNLEKDPDWGDPLGYDLKVTKSGQGIETEYSVAPKPRRELDASITKAFADKKINLEKLYEGGNPFE